MAGNTKAEAMANEAAQHLHDYVHDGKTHQGDKVATVPSTHYTDSDRWNKEIETLFKVLPLCLAASSQLCGPNTYLALNVMDIPILVTRDGKGEAHVFLNVCSHRASPVAEVGCGRRKRLTCKYHGWTYGTDGKLVGVADTSKFGDVDKSKLGLTELPSLERAGLIFGVLTPNVSTDWDEYFDHALYDLEEMEFESWAFLGQRELTGANWKVASDGYFEGYHFAALHPDTIHPRTPSNVMHFQAFGPHLRIAFPQVGIEQTFKDVPREQWGAMENNGFDFVRVLFPNVSIFVAPEITQLAQIFPGPTPDKNRTVLNYFRKEPPSNEADSEALEGMMDWLLSVVRDEDYAMGDQVQTGLLSGAYERVQFGRNELGNQFFHEYVQWYLDGDTSAEKPKI